MKVPSHHRRVVPWLIVAGLLGLLAKVVYRPFATSAGVNDLGLHGVLPNFFWAVFLALVFARFSPSPAKSCASAFVANAVYELDQLRHDGSEDTLLSSVGRTFDPWDIVAAGLGCLVAYGLLRRLGTSRSQVRVRRR